MYLLLFTTLPFGSIVIMTENDHSMHCKTRYEKTTKVFENEDLEYENQGSKHFSADAIVILACSFLRAIYSVTTNLFCKCQTAL